MKTPIKPFILLLLLLITTDSKAQDSLSIEQLQPLTHTFNVTEGRLTGDGAQFLKEAMSEAQFTMIGEYHGSKRISELTEAMIPVLDSLGYQKMVLEVGPVSGRLLNQLDTPVIQNLKKLNEQYLIREADGYANPPIPFFENIEDASFLAKAKDHGWEVMGIDQEYLFGYPMLLDLMFGQLSEEQQQQHDQIYREVVDSLNAYYQKSFNEEVRLAVSIANSTVVKEFLSRMSEVPENVETANALMASNHIYWLNAKKRWVENNSVRVKYMKQQLRTQLQKDGFDLTGDKLLIKMGGYHLSKGFSPLSLYEVGNTLNEIAEFNGNTSLNITFSNRFYVEDGTLVDVLESDDQFYQRLKDFNRMGKKDEWVVIDLRPLVAGHFYYPIKYKFNKHIEELVKRYDLLIIPATDTEPTPNYGKK